VDTVLHSVAYVRSWKAPNVWSTMSNSSNEGCKSKKLTNHNQLSRDTVVSLTPSLRVARNRIFTRIFTRDQKLRWAEIIRSQ